MVARSYEALQQPHSTLYTTPDLFNTGTRPLGVTWCMVLMVITGLKCVCVDVRDAGKWKESKTRTEPRENNPKSFSCIPYIQGVLGAISRILAKVNIHTHFKPVNTIRSMVSHHKDRVPTPVYMLNKFGVVYKVEYGCCNASYVGETKTRVQAEHWMAVQRGEMNASTLVEHVRNVSHHAKWDSMNILGVIIQHYSRVALEAIRIKRQKNSINRDQGKLGTAYDSVIWLHMGWPWDGMGWPWDGMGCDGHGMGWDGHGMGWDGHGMASAMAIPFVVIWQSHGHPIWSHMTD